MVWLEYAGFLRHYCLEGFILNDLHTNKIYILGVSFVFISTLYLAAYMASSISVRLREREKSLKEANLLLEEKDRIKSEYVLRVSHDIKEHLASIQTCLEPVAGGMLGGLNPGQKDLIQRATERTDKLLFFVKALLEITRIKLSRYIDMEPFSLRKTVENAVHMVESKAWSKGITLASSIEPGIDMIKGDEIYIQETIANLLANAVKYTPLNGKIDVCVKDQADSVLIQVRDTGIGIPEDEVQNIFNEFYRATNAKRIERDGTGLGLAIARQVVERHNGKIWVESEEGKGSTFSIILPK
jgi:signal transduction histidine kinase